MDSSISYNDDEHIESHLSKVQCLEMAYQETLRNTDVIIKEEGARRLRLRILMLENENDDLHEQLALGDDRIDILEQESGELRGLLEQAQEDVCRQETEIKTQTRELQNLKAELAAMNGISSDTTKVLTEKLSLARELATLRPELEHLRSQMSYQQTVLAEKLALQRQVSTLEVELETEKRASKRAAQKSRNSDAEMDLQSQIDQLQKDLTREKREREKALKEAEREHQYQVEELQKELSQEKKARERNRKETETDTQDRLEELQKELAREKLDGEKARKEAEKELKSSETRTSVLESKLDQFRTKLRATKDQLKDCQTELSQVRAAAAKTGPGLSNGDAAIKNPRKRGALEISTEVEIGTPDGVAMRGKRPITKRGRTDHTMVGEKSMFSITPFLNRTISVAPETPGRDTVTEVPEGHQQQVAEATMEVVRAQPATSKGDPSPTTALKVRGRKKAAGSAPAPDNKVLGEAKASNKNKKAPMKKSRVISTLESVNEEEGDENEVRNFVPAAAKAAPMVFKAGQVQLKNTDGEETGPKMKKRKLLGGGKTLFDEEDGEATKRPAKISLGPPKMLGKGGLAASKGSLKGGISTASGFGGFSPLKKDRRGIGASFLA